MKLIGASLAVTLLTPSIVSAEWTQPELSALESLCLRAATEIEASTAERARICACAARVIGANVKSVAALEAAGPEAARAALGTSVGACSYASAGTKSKEEPLSPQARLARIAELKKKGALPTFRGWDLEAAHGYLVQCEAAALRTNPSASVLSIDATVSARTDGSPWSTNNGETARPPSSGSRAGPAHLKSRGASLPCGPRARTSRTRDYGAARGDRATGIGGAAAMSLWLHSTNVVGWQ
jgi:hypothetical protein